MSLIFPGIRCARSTAALLRPDQANELALFLRTGPFWQDTAGTTPANVLAHPVRRWDDVSGNGKHAVYSSGNVPTLRAPANGGIEMLIAGGGQLVSPASVAGTAWTLYATLTDLNLGDAGIGASDGTGIATTIQPAAGGAAAFGCGGSYVTPIADTGTEDIYGMSANGSAVVCFKGGTESAQTLVSALFGSLRLGYSTGGGGFAWVGRIKNVALYSTTHDATMRAAVRAMLATL